MAQHHIERIRHETRRRIVTVAKVEMLTPRMKRIHFTSSDLHDFTSASPDDHIKLFFHPDEATAAGERACMRDYTPRSFDAKQGQLVVDFALHDAGPATSWAKAAKPGDNLEIGGPRGSALIPNDFDWYLFIGDETALPAIGRWVEEAAPGVVVTTLVVVDSQAEVQHFQTRAQWTPIWVLRNDGADDAALLQAALRAQPAPAGDGFVWIAAEAQVARDLRAAILEERQHPRQWMKAAGYWMRGKADAHEKIED